MDYRAVDPKLGDWGDVGALGGDFKLAFDLVINHASSRGVWFQGFLNGDPEYEGWFLTRPEGYDASRVVRPRTHPLLTPYARADGTKVLVWTTFSEDQVDLDFSNPAVLAEMLDVFLDYVQKGARIVRLDAIAYLWKEDGHPCLHHPRTHAVVKLFRAVVDALKLDVRLLTETNVPHPENVAYFGSGDEAHLVYNFALPPLTLHAFAMGDASRLSEWARGLRAPPGCSFLNFLASHDGIGLTPARGVVDEEAFRRTLDLVLERGCLVSNKATQEGPIPYELNASWFDAIADPDLPEDLRIRAHLASHAIAASLDGMPAVYIHSILGTPNWTEGPAIRGYNRAINRRILALKTVESALTDPSSRPSRCLSAFRLLYSHRGREPALAPETPSRVLSGDGPVFAIVRGGPGKRILCAVNVSPRPTRFELEKNLGIPGRPYDPTTGEAIFWSGVSASLELPPYGVIWLPLDPP
jgi:sucrose phosphorylase